MNPPHYILHTYLGLPYVTKFRYFNLMNKKQKKPNSPVEFRYSIVFLFRVSVSIISTCSLAVARSPQPVPYV